MSEATHPDIPFTDDLTACCNYALGYDPATGARSRAGHARLWTLHEKRSIIEKVLPDIESRMNVADP